MNLEVTEMVVPADISPENEISTGDKIEAILKELKQPGDYRIGGIDLSSKNLNIDMYFDYCDKGLRISYCNPDISLMILITTKTRGYGINSEIFLADSPPFGSWDYSDSCNETNSYRKIDLEHKASVDEMFSKIVQEGYQEIIKDKPHSIDKKVEIIFQNLTEF